MKTSAVERSGLYDGLHIPDVACLLQSTKKGTLDELRIRRISTLLHVPCDTRACCRRMSGDHAAPIVQCRPDRAADGLCHAELSTSRPHHQPQKECAMNVNGP